MNRRLLPQARRILATAALAVALPVSLTAQTHAVSGRVVTPDLQPLAGVSVFVLGTGSGTLTNASGTYSLVAPNASATLVFTSVGFRTVEEAIAGRSVVNVVLEAEAVRLDELVVVGYGQQTRATVSGAVSQVTASDIENASTTTVANALAGRIQGINTRLTTSGPGQGVTAGTGGRIAGDVNDGRPGSASVLQIRNMGAPLFVIDGVPTTDAREFNHLNAADIETISILKDASAAVYGFRAANGVVLVTTKKGSRVEAPRVRLDGWYGWQDMTRYHYQDNLANAYEHLFTKLDSQNNRNQPRSMTKEELERWRVGGPGYESTDHWKLLYNQPHAPQYTLNANLSGGAENVRYYLSGGHTSQDYNFRENNFSRSNFTANLQSTLTEGLTIGTELRARYEVQDNVGVQGDTDVIRTHLLTAHTSWPHQKPWTGPNGDLINGDVRALTRSVATLNKETSGEQVDTRRQASGNFWIQYSFPFGTTVKGTVSLSNRLREFDLARKSFDAYWCNDDNTVCERRLGSPDRTRQHLKNVTDEVFSNVTASHSLLLGSHSLTANAFWEMQGSESRETWLISQSPTNYSHLIGLTDVEDLGNDWGISRRASAGGRLDYDYQQKYLFSALGRYDGSYLYDPNRRWGFFPGFSVGWRVTEEPFLRDRFGFLTELKLRASWGQTGREQGISDWGYLGGATYNVGAGSVLDGAMIPGVRPRGLPVTNLSWVTSTSSNVGLDIALFDGRLAGEFDLFERKLTGLPAPRTDVRIPNEMGYTLPNENLNSESNIGFEGIVRWTDRIGRISYSFAPNITVSRQKIGIRYGEQYGSAWDRYRNGQVDRWQGVAFGYRVNGQFQSMEEIAEHPVNIDGQGNRLLLPGDLIYEDVNGDRIINAMDMRPIGFSTSTTPIVSFGATTNVSYGGVSLSLDLSGGALYSHQRDAATKFPSGHNMAKYAMDRWYRVDPFDPQSEWHRGYYPPWREGQTNPSFNRVDSFWRTNVKYVRVRRVELAYSVPDVFATRAHLSGVRVYTGATNPISFDNVGFYNIDPEIAENFALNYPTIRLINVGFSATLGGARVAAAALPVPQAQDE